ncbi:MAG: 1-acyl-sn-glycerol-3-phosphate acyltransferase [Deltaproteobacteria bacterium HGW-Deltaproteobacteria-19]|nr:MAG: 1-acyl-sn-glycerol-3-phosphate acyltransferase [Deltaproteobacteria bacterium HGW-Deltaproteobacteria-19]
MQMNSPQPMNLRRSVFRALLDLLVTLLLWVYFLAGTLILPFYGMAHLFSNDREATFQGMNSRFYRGFFRLVQWLIPGLSLRIGADVRTLRSTVIVSNHLSYLDPILFLSIFDRQKTIVRSDFFHYPIFGWVLKTAGYLPSSANGDLFSTLMIKRVEDMDRYLSTGGNLFIFPEGTRSRDGRLHPFSRGAFRIAARCRAPLGVVRITNTHRLFPPDRFLFHTGIREPVTIELLALLHPEWDAPDFSLNDLIARVQALYDERERQERERDFAEAGGPDGKPPAEGAGTP